MFPSLPKHSEPLVAIAVKSLETIALDVGCVAFFAVAIVMALVLTVTDWIADHR